jgi:hypothetical protein
LIKQRHYNRLKYIAWTRVHNEQLAEDILHDTIAATYSDSKFNGKSEAGVYKYIRQNLLWHISKYKRGLKLKACSNNTDFLEDKPEVLASLSYNSNVENDIFNRQIVEKIQTKKNFTKQERNVALAWIVDDDRLPYTKDEETIPKSLGDINSRRYYFLRRVIANKMKKFVCE